MSTVHLITNWMATRWKLHICKENLLLSCKILVMPSDTQFISCGCQVKNFTLWKNFNGINLHITICHFFPSLKWSPRLGTLLFSTLKPFQWFCFEFGYSHLTYWQSVNTAGFFLFFFSVWQTWQALRFTRIAMDNTVNKDSPIKKTSYLTVLYTPFTHLCNDSYTIIFWTSTRADDLEP